MRTVADRHRLAAYHNKHCWRAFRGYQHRWPWTTLNLSFQYALLVTTLSFWVCKITMSSHEKFC